MIVEHKGNLVEIDNVFEMMDGTIMVTITALDGKPYVGGDKWPVQTNHTTVRATDLNWPAPNDCTCTPRDDVPCKFCQQHDICSDTDEIPY